MATESSAPDPSGTSPRQTFNDRLPHLRARILIALGLIVGAVLVALLLYPVRSGLVRAGIAASAFGLWGVLLLWIYPRRKLFVSVLAATALLLIFVAAPGRGHDSERLRSRYIKALDRFEGAPYVWGGETVRGIDCSGLLRAALENAKLEEGLLTLNPRLSRAALSMWWYDTSARALQEEHKGLTRRLFEAPSLNDVDGTQLLPGDLAITRDGVHSLVYLGDGTWMEADPMARKVIREKTPSTNGWFRQPMTILRWRVLEPLS